jgi:hypothetical protein
MSHHMCETWSQHTGWLFAPRFAAPKTRVWHRAAHPVDDGSEEENLERVREHQ